MKIQLLTSKSSWLYLNRKNYLKKVFKKYSKNFSIITNFRAIKKSTDICVILSYYKIIPAKFLRNSKYNIVVHESDLPKNKGFSPLYWQILRGKTKIVFTLFEVSNGVDNGNFYFKKMFIFKKNLLFNEIKNKQLECALILISKFIKGYKNKKLKTQRQTGKSTFLKKRTKNDSKIDLNKSLKSQINLLRISNNSYFPAFFNYENTRYEIFLKKTKK